MIHTGQGIGYIILDADAVAAIAGLPVNGVAADADDRLRLEGQGQVVAAGSRPGGGQRGQHRVLGACGPHPEGRPERKPDALRALPQRPGRQRDGLFRKYIRYAAGPRTRTSAPGF